MSAADEAHHRLIDQVIARGALWSRPLIAAFRATPRHLFLTRLYHYPRELGGWRERRIEPDNAADLRLVYADRAVTTRLGPAAPGQAAPAVSSSSQPSLMAQMLEDLRLAPGLRVLEVGAGTGYNAALLAHVCGPVVSVDIDREVLTEAGEHLMALPDRRVELLHADGRQPLPGRGPFDRIQVTAATPDLEPAWLDQLAAGGLVQAPLEVAPGLSYLVQGTVRDGQFEGRLTRPAYFMALRDEQETPPEGEAAAVALPDPNRLSAVAAPWAGWSDRKGLANGAGLTGALAFLGWLHGLAVSYVQLAEGRPAYGVADLVAGHACWLGQGEWRVTGAAGEALGRRLWQEFLEAGGPRPTEFRLTARVGKVAPGRSTTDRLSFVRQGPRTAQRWNLPEPRERPEWG